MTHQTCNPTMTDYELGGIYRQLQDALSEVDRLRAWIRSTRDRDRSDAYGIDSLTAGFSADGEYRRAFYKAWDEETERIVGG
jgi:hypothetical protein